VLQTRFRDVLSASNALAARWDQIELNGAYGVPQGGYVPAVLVAQALGLDVLDAPQPGCLIIDDLVDSGRTLCPYADKGYYVDALYRKPHSPKNIAPDAIEVDDWIVFPWEKEDGAPQDGIVRLIEYIGEDPTRDGLLETPKRVLKAFKEMTEGYDQSAATILGTTFDVGQVDEMIIVRNIEFVSLCEHHMLPFTGTATVAYIPRHRVVGLSKIARLVDMFSRRLQVQERLTQQITAAMDEVLMPEGSACIIEAAHSCMGCRGVRKPSARMVTSSLTGVFRQHEVRAELLSLAD
jgi:GTP cyclohydrolase IA